MVVQIVKNPPATWETWVRSLDREDPLETAAHSSILAWRIPWTEEPGGLQFMGSQRVGHNCATKNTAHAISLVIRGMKTETMVRNHCKTVGVAKAKRQYQVLTSTENIGNSCALLAVNSHTLNIHAFDRIHA